MFKVQSIGLLAVLAVLSLTTLAGEIAALASVLEGWTLKTIWVASPAVISKSTDVAELKPEALATRVNPLPALSIEMSL